MELYGYRFNLRRWCCLSKTFCKLSMWEQIFSRKISTISKISTTSGSSLLTPRTGTTKQVENAKTTSHNIHTITTTNLKISSSLAVPRPQIPTSPATSKMTGITSQPTGVSTSNPNISLPLNKKGTTTLLSCSKNHNTKGCLITTKVTSPMTLTTIKTQSTTGPRSSLASIPSHCLKSTTWVPGSTKPWSCRPPTWSCKRLQSGKRSICLLQTRRCLKSSCPHEWSPWKIEI